MTRNLQRRLQKLESQILRQPTEQEKQWQKEKQWEIVRNFMICAVAYYLGDLTPEEAIIEAHGRALGYSNPHELRKAIDAKDPDFFERDHLARIKLLAKFGVSPEHEWEEIVEALRRMEAGLPEQYQRCYR